MDSRDVQNGIYRSWDVVNSLQLGETFSNPRPLEVNTEFRDVALSRGSNYVDVYLQALSLSYYNFLLVDFSFFQFSCSGEDRVRYAYYPNPFLGGDEQGIEAFKRRHELVLAGFITQEEYLTLLRETRGEARAPLLRYDNSPDQRKEPHHPCSHFHIGTHGGDRWALNRLLTPLAFTLIVLKHYYGRSWQVRGDDHSDEYGNRYESQLVREKANCPLISNAFFSDREARSFFFS